MPRSSSSCPPMRAWDGTTTPSGARSDSGTSDHGRYHTVSFGRVAVFAERELGNKGPLTAKSSCPSTSFTSTPLFWRPPDDQSATRSVTSHTTHCGAANGSSEAKPTCGPYSTSRSPDQCGVKIGCRPKSNPRPSHGLLRLRGATHVPSYQSESSAVTTVAADGIADVEKRSADRHTLSGSPPPTPSRAPSSR